jgi:hypothetical protein
MSIARFRHVAMPLLGAGNQPSTAWCKRPGRPFMENRQVGACQSCLPASERVPSSARLERIMEGPWMRWEQPGGLASTGARTGENDYSPEIRLPAEAVAADNSKRRPRFHWGQAEAFREETGKSIGRASRGMGPSACARIAEITSGRAISQQGLATTCKDSSDQGKPEVGERDLAWRMSLSERRRRGNALREDPGDPRRWGNTSAAQRGSRHLAGSRPPPDRAQTRVTGSPEGTSRAEEQTTPARGVCAPALEFRLLWEGSAGTSQGRQPDSGNPTVRDERGGLGKRGHGSRTEVRRRKPRRHHRTLPCARSRSIQTWTRRRPRRSEHLSVT